MINTTITPYTDNNNTTSTTTTNRAFCLIWDLFNYKQGRIQHDGYSTIVWTCILGAIVVINISIFVIRIKVPLYCTNIMYVLALSTFLNQALYGTSLCVGEILSLVMDRLSCAVLKQIYFLQELGQLSTILGIATLTFSQYKDVKLKQSILNQMSKTCENGLLLSNRRHIYFLIAFVWGTSIIMSALPILLVDVRLCLILPSLVGIVGVVSYIVILCKFYILIRGFNAMKRQDTTQLRLDRSLAFLRMSGLLLAVTWIPSVIARLFWFLERRDELIGNISYILCSCAIIYPICQPLLYSYVTPEIRAYIRLFFRNKLNTQRSGRGDTRTSSERVQSIVVSNITDGNHKAKRNKVIPESHSTNTATNFLT